VASKRLTAYPRLCRTSTHGSKHNLPPRHNHRIRAAIAISYQLRTHPGLTARPSSEARPVHVACRGERVIDYHCVARNIQGLPSGGRHRSGPAMYRLLNPQQAVSSAKLGFDTRDYSHHVSDAVPLHVPPDRSSPLASLPAVQADAPSICE
jgi:hypothetical protein